VTASPLKAFSGSLAGGCFVALTQLLTRDTVPPLLRAAVGLFSLAIPFLLIFALLDVPRHRFRELVPRERVTWLLFTGSSIAGLLGLTCLFWFICPGFGCVFGISCVLAYYFLLSRVM
jgi:hypothetical protein